jgi:hypothetical protein
MDGENLSYMGKADCETIKEIMSTGHLKMEFQGYVYRITEYNAEANHAVLVWLNEKC